MFSIKGILKTSILLSFSLTAFGNTTYADEYRLAHSLETTAAQLNQTDLSCEVNSDCTTYAVGSKAFGGPTSYMVSSKHNSHKKIIQELLD